MEQDFYIEKEILDGKKFNQNGVRSTRIIFESNCSCKNQW